jgi:hypothetical protein
MSGLLSRTKGEDMSAAQTAPAEREQAQERERGTGAGIYLAFVPWLLFSVIDRHDSLLAGALVALIAAIVIALPGIRAGRPKTLELGAIVAFAGFSLVAVLTDPGANDWLARYARAIAAALLALIALASLLGTPFTEQYARETVDRRYWSSPVFKRINRELTLTWALVFAAMVPSHLVAGALDTQRANTIFNWVVPIVLIVWAAKRTERVSAAAGENPQRA